jgi:hypothetical protein
MIDHLKTARNHPAQLAKTSAAKSYASTPFSRVLTVYFPRAAAATPGCNWRRKNDYAADQKNRLTTIRISTVSGQCSPVTLRALIAFAIFEPKSHLLVGLTRIGVDWTDGAMPSQRRGNHILSFLRQLSRMAWSTSVGSALTIEIIASSAWSIFPYSRCSSAATACKVRSFSCVVPLSFIYSNS